MKLKTLLRAMAAAALLSTFDSQLSVALAQSTAFTYQGRLINSGNAANGLYDFQFALFNAVTNGTQVTPAVTNSAVTVSNGLFTVAIDFGNVFNGSNFWLAITVSTNGANSFAALSPRQPITPAPYATYAPNAGTAGSANSVSAANIAGPISLAQLPPSLITNGASGVNISGTLVGNGSGVTNVSVSSLTVTPNNALISWGNNFYGQASVPVGLGNVVSAAAGNVHSLALRSDGTVVAWGANNQGQATVPTGLSNVVAVSAGEYHSLALKSDGTVVAWGYNSYGQVTLPVGLSHVVSIAAGYDHSLALKNDGTVVAWGGSTASITNVPAGLTNAVSVAAGAYHSLALKNDGTVVAWGYDGGTGRATVPAGLSNVVAVAAGALHNLAVKSDGTVVAWGDNSYGQSTVPAGLNNVVSVAANEFWSMALKSDGTLVAWGDDYYGQTTVPAGLNHVIALAAGCAAEHALVLQQSVNSPAALLNWNNTFNGNVTVNGTISGNGSGLTGLNASQITSGTLSAARLPANVLTNGASSVSINTNSVAGTLTLNGTFYQNSPGYSVATTIIEARPGDQFPLAVQAVGNNNLLLIATNQATFSVPLSAGSGLTASGGTTLNGWLTANNGASFSSGGAQFSITPGQLFGVANSSAVTLDIVGVNGTLGVWDNLQVSGTISQSSDRNVKENFSTVDPQAVLEKVASLPMSEWNYKKDTAGQKHLGPMAQDFYAAFGLNGQDDKHIALVDEGGVALTAIQGLNQKLNEKDAKIEAQSVEIAELKARLNDLSRTVQSLVGKK